MDELNNVATKQLSGYFRIRFVDEPPYFKIRFVDKDNAIIEGYLSATESVENCLSATENIETPNGLEENENDEMLQN